MTQQDKTSPQVHILNNGLKVIFEKTGTSPVVSLYAGVKIGSAWESDKEAGLSHVLEHMVFKGTKSYGPGAISSIVEGCGGDLNAYTSFDQTVYYINLPSRHLHTGLKLIREMLFEATIDPEELAREQEVILEEIRRGLDNPQRYLGQILFSLAYQTHTYGRPVIGFDHTVKSFTASVVKNFYHSWYVPNNIVLGVCGDVDEEALLQFIKAEFLEYKEKPLCRPNLNLEPPLSIVRTKKESRNIQGNYLNIAFPVPAFLHEDVPAIDLMAHYLGGSETSRLYQKVKEEKKLVNAVHASAYTPRYPGIFVIDANIPDENLESVLPAIHAEINHVRANLIPQEQLERAKQGMEASLVYEKETCEGTARKWISYETTGDDFAFESIYMKRLHAVTPEEIRRVAQKYLNTEACFLTLLHSDSNKVSTQSLKWKTSKTTKQKAKLIEEYKDIQKYKLSNGLQIVLKQNSRLPLMSMKCAGLGGLRYETRKNNGISNLTFGVLEKGTTTKTSLKIAELSEQMSGHVQAFAGKNSWGVNAAFLSSKKSIGFDLFTDLILHPFFDPEELSKEKKLTLEAIKNQEDSLGSLAVKTFEMLLYPHHPYGMPILGSKKLISTFKPDSLAKFYKSLLVPGQMVASVVGDFQTDEILDYLQETLGSLPANPRKKPNIKAEKASGTLRQKIIRKNKMQAHLILGFLGTTLKSRDRFALEVMNNILSGMGGRLFLELRDKQSLAYTVSAMHTEGLEPGYMGVYMGCDPSKVEKATQGILHELQKLKDIPVEKEELERAQNYIAGNHEIELQRNDTQCSQLLFDTLYGNPLKEYDDYVHKIYEVTSGDILQVARKYLRLNAYCLALIRP